MCNIFFTCSTIGPLLSATIVISLLLCSKYANDTDYYRQRNWTLMAQIVLLLSVCILVHYPTFIITRTVSWTSVVLSILSPLFTPANEFTWRIISIFTAISVPFSFLSVSYESLFLPTLFITLLTFYKLEAVGLHCPWPEFLNLTSECNEQSTGNLDAKRAFFRAWLYVSFILTIGF